MSAFDVEGDKHTVVRFLKGKKCCSMSWSYDFCCSLGAVVYGSCNRKHTFRITELHQPSLGMLFLFPINTGCRKVPIFCLEIQYVFHLSCLVSRCTCVNITMASVGTGKVCLFICKVQLD